MGPDVLATQGARASTTMLLAVLNRNNSMPARWGLMRSWPGATVPAAAANKISKHE